MKKSPYIALCLTLMTSVLFADNIPPLTDFLPVKTSAISHEFGSVYSREALGTLEIEILQEESLFRYMAESSAISYVFETDNRFALISAHVLIHDSIYIDFIKVSEIDIRLQDDGTYLYRALKKNGRWQEKSIKLTDNAIYGDASGAYFQALLLNSGGSLPDGEFQIFFPPYPPGKMTYTQLLMNAAEVPGTLGDYPLPEEFRPFAETGEELIVMEVKMGGLMGAFYPYEYYYAFSAEEPYSLRGYWGGNMGTDDFFVYYE